MSLWPEWENGGCGWTLPPLGIVLVIEVIREALCSALH